MSYKESALYCNDMRYVKNLLNSLVEAKNRQDIQRIIELANEMGRYEALCGSIQPIRQFKENLQRISEELGIADHPDITRAVAAKPQSAGEKLFTMVGMEIIQINEDGTRQFLDPPPKEEPSKIPDHAHTPNYLIQREQRKRGEK
jgi:hypothetical protein